MRARLLLGLALVLALGCGGRGFAPVSGTVKLNGKPLANATVSFQPLAAPGSINAGAGFVGKTDDQGHYTLEAGTGQTGAIVGQHKVMITLLETQVGDSDARPPRGGWPLANKIPDRYNNATKLTYDVPTGGTDQANFDLTAP